MCHLGPLPAWGKHPPRPSPAPGHCPRWAPGLSSCGLRASSALASPARHRTAPLRRPLQSRGARGGLPFSHGLRPRPHYPSHPGCACPSVCSNPGLLQLLQGPTQSPGPWCVASAAVPGPEGPVSTSATGRRGVWRPARPSPRGSVRAAGTCGPRSILKRCSQGSLSAP